MSAPPRLEKAEQVDGVRLLRSIGAAVYVLGTVRRRGDHPGTMMSPGLPDVQVFLPQRDGKRRLLVWEVKRAKGGRLSPEQRAYQTCCLEADVAHVVGPCQALVDWLLREGYVRERQLPAYRLGGVA